MKLRYLLVSFLAALGFAACEAEPEMTLLDEVQVSQSFVTFPAQGGSAKITVTAQDSWTVDTTGTSKWLKVSPMSGSAGETDVTFTAVAATSTIETTIAIKSGEVSQTIKLLQMTEKVELPITPVKEIMEKGVDGVTYRAQGTVANIYNTQYGNWFLDDGAGNRITIYGTLNSKGEEKKFLEVGIEEGDFVIVEGPFTLYGTTPELVNVTVINIEKSLLKVEEVVYGEVAEGEVAPTEISLEGGSCKVRLTNKTTGLDIIIPDEAKSWLSVGSVSTAAGESIVTLNALPNNAGDRNTTVSFSSKAGGKTYNVTATIAQKGAIIEATAAQINAAADGDTQYRVTGVISKDTGSDYGNIYIKDHTDTVYVYGVLNAAGETKKWKTMGIAEGDIVTVVGPKTSHKEAPQMKNVSVENHIAVPDLTVADFLTKETNKSVYYQLTGTVKNYKDGDLYGNFDLEDATGSVYVYGVLLGWGGEKKHFPELGVKNGDTITIICTKDFYASKNQHQAANAFYVSHETPGEGGDPTTPGTPATIDLKYTLGANAYDDGVATINGVENTKTIKIGTSSKAGEFTLTIPAGTKDVSFYAVAWKGATGVKLDITPAVTGAATLQLDINANDGATGNSPYTITSTEADKYSVATNNEEEIGLKVTCSKRVIFWGITAK